MSFLKKTNRSLLTTCIITALTAPLSTMVYAATTVQGQVSDANGAPLAGVRVSVKNSQQSVFTDATGRYNLRQIDAEQVTLTFEYIGLPTSERQLTLNQQSQQLNVSLTPRDDIERIQITSQRDASNRALNEYRAADAISNFIAADDMGQFVDQNVAESLQRLPGTSITRDQGEGRFVSVRGLSSSLNTVTLNGVRVGTPEDGSRAVPLDVIPTGSVESIELVKAPTADMPGDALGGAIDIKSPSPFDRDGLSVRYRAEASYNDLSGDTSPKMQFNISDVVNDKFGYAFGINYLDRKLESDNVEAEYDKVDFAGEDVFSVIEVQQRKYYVNRERLGTNLNLEYRPSDASRLYLNTIYSEFTDEETRQRSIFSFEDGELSAFDGSSAVINELPGDAIKRRIRFRTKEQDTLAIDAGGEYRFRDWTLNYRAGYSKTRERVLDENEGRYEYNDDSLGARYQIGQGLPSFDILENGQATRLHLDNANYTLDRAVLVPKIVNDDEYNAGFDAEFPYAFGLTELTLKTGFDMRLKDKYADVGEYELRDVPDASLADLTIAAPDYGLGDLGDGISSGAYMDYFYQNRDQFKEREKDLIENRALLEGQDFDASEDVYAGYLMATVDLTRTRIIAGVRVEQTRFEAQGKQLTFDENGGLTISDRFAKSDYTNVLPSVHIAYDLADDMKLRAAWTNTIARPSFKDLSPRAEVDLEDLDVELGNPDLDPYEAMNWDLMYDWYYADSSLLSLGVFYKDIDNYVVNLTSNNVAEFDGYDVERPVNATSASVKGFEANWQHSVNQGALAGFLFGANLTLLDTELELLERAGESFSIPESADKNANLFIGFERGNFSTRLSWTYRDEYLEEVGDDSRYDIYVAPHKQLDLTASYRFSKAFELVAEITNINDAPLELYQGSKDYTLQWEEYGPTFSLGVKGRF
ncbi:TonB-dependent receptor [Idiomarina xiamenensis]|uniref:TonB-dependent outer membrane receptor n=1 Tax=Idiomarina xiamenensis 10-D-4 TaxID=740709 RepID=K2JZQ9_9GAMM|nr:TonB-dependent receptor [Idiomarina xiamenensis]EKE80938.1 TonB-dependent outer membrane receptor [Idiomarina xiamenensis 10-D-4]